jgi:hypothetical protein
MLSIGLWRWYINIITTILDIIHRPVFYSKYNISDTGFFTRLHVEPTQLDPIDWVILCLGPETETTFIYWTQLSKDRIQYPKCYIFNKRQDDG